MRRWLLCPIGESHEEVAICPFGVSHEKVVIVSIGSKS